MRTCLLLVLGLLACGTPATAHEFTWEKLAVTRMKLDPYFKCEDYVDSYMQIFRPQAWKVTKNDEFRRHAARRETITIMEREIKQFDLEEPFVLNTWLEIGEYDFDKRQFPIENASAGHYWYESNYRSGEFPGQFRVYMSNFEVYCQLPLKEDAAEQLIASRKDRYGQVNRRIPVRISFVMTQRRSKESELEGRVLNVKFYTDNERTRLLHETQAAKSPQDPVEARQESD